MSFIKRLPAILFIAVSGLVTFSRLISFQYEIYSLSSSYPDIGNAEVDEKSSIHPHLEPTLTDHTQELQPQHQQQHIQPSTVQDTMLNHEQQSRSRIESIAISESPLAKQQWKNEHDIVHVIYTRFMQHQPHLLHLGMARLKLFETFCFPSIQGQTSQEFLWMIRTDPELHPTLREGIIRVIRNMTNIVLIGSNDIRKGSLPDKNFRSTKALLDVSADTVFYGNRELVESYYAAAKNRTLIETNLDADDGLALGYVATIQQQTVFHQRQHQREQNLPLWFNWCLGEHFEWQFFVPFDSNSTKGYLRAGSTHICVTPGLAWVTGPNNTASPAKFITGHHLIKRQSPNCKPTQLTNCWRELPMPNGSVMGVRARSPTSTGMNTVVVPSDRVNGDRAQQEDAQAWPVFLSSFRIGLDLVVRARKFLQDELKDLVEENLQGQCQKDHSCSEGINKRLKLSAPRQGQWVNKHNIVHTVHTWLAFDKKNKAMASNQLQVFKTFALASMELQSTMEFLWIVRIIDSAVPDLERQLERTFAQSPVNVLLVRSNKSTVPNNQNALCAPDAIQNYTVSGDLDLLRDYRQAAQKRPLLETFLSATDALSKHFLEQRQNEISSGPQIPEKDKWICPDKYMEWLYSSHVPGDNLGLLSLPQNATAGACDSNRPGASRLRKSLGANEDDHCDSGTDSDCVQWLSPPSVEALRASLTKEVREPNNLDAQRTQHKRLAKTLLDEFGLMLGDIRSLHDRIQKTDDIQ